jgi:hypothetical protein
MSVEASKDVVEGPPVLREAVVGLVLEGGALRVLVPEETYREHAESVATAVVSRHDLILSGGETERLKGVCTAGPEATERAVTGTKHGRVPVVGLGLLCLGGELGDGAHDLILSCVGLTPIVSTVDVRTV